MINVCSYCTDLLQLSEPTVLIMNWDLEIITRRQPSRQLYIVMTKYAEQRGREERTLCHLVSVQLRGMVISMFISVLFSLFTVTIVFLLQWIFFFNSILFLRVSILIKALLPSAVKEIAHPDLACSYWSHCCMLNGLMWPYNHI